MTFFCHVDHEDHGTCDESFCDILLCEHHERRNMQHWSGQLVNPHLTSTIASIPYMCLSGLNTDIFIFISFYFVLICSPHIDHKTRKHRNWFISQPQIIRVFMTKPSGQHQHYTVMNPNNQHKPSPATPLHFNTLPSFTSRT